MKKTFIKKGIFTCIAAILGVASSFAQTVNTGAVTPTAICAGSSFTVAYTTSAAVTGTPAFSVELSDATGTFPTTPNVIGTGNASPLSATIPAGTAAGTAYKVRVTAPSPIVTGTPSAVLSVSAIPAAPVVTSPVSYSQNQPAQALSATALSGNTLKWYGTSATGGTAATDAPSPSTSAIGTLTYYVSQVNAAGCESSRAAISVVVSACVTPAPPVVSNPVNYTQNQVAAALEATALSGNTLRWYGNNSSGGTPTTTPPTPATNAVGTLVYYVSQITAAGCESSRAAISVVVSACTAPAAPVVTSPVNYTQNQVASPLAATALSGNTLNWYGNNAIGGTPTTTVPTPSTATAGTLTYYVSQVNSTGCESTRSAINVVVSACAVPAPPVVTNPVNYTQNETPIALKATALTGNTLNWYGQNASGGTASTTAPIPSTSTVGTVVYYVSQMTSAGCESARAAISVVVSTCTTPAAPVVVTPLNYSVGQVGELTATELEGATLRWYGTNQTGGNFTLTKPVPVTTTAGSTTYYVSQIIGTCESPRAAIVVNVAAAPCTTPAAPVVVTPLNYTVGQSATLTATAITGATLNWYGTAATGGTPSTTKPVPSTASVGTITYYVSQSVGTCESPRSAIVVNVAAACTTPAAPVVVTPLSYTVGQTAELTATAITGATLNWYGTAATGGTPSTTKPVPSTSAIGTITYYVSQSVGTCESPRSAIVVNVAAPVCATPAPTVVSPVNYMVGATNAVALTATGTALKWYTSATGGTALGSAPTPITTTASTTSYYVSQTLNGCEGPRAEIVVSVATCTPPPAPTGQSLYTLCEGATPQQLTATGQNLKWYQYFQGKGQPIGSAPTPSTSGPQTPTSPTYYVTQTINGCESSGLDITVAVNRVAATPTITNPDAICQNSPVTSSLLTSSINGGFLAENYRWYETSTSTTPQALPVPSTLTSGTKDYYVTYWPARFCESPKAKITVTVKVTPDMPKTQEYFSYCVGATATKLTAEGQNLKWYGGDGTTVLNTAPTPATTDAHNALTPSFYVSQTVNGCESIKAPISINVNAISPTPVVTSPAAICQNSEVTSQILLSSVPQNLSYIWYDSDGKAYPTVPTPSSATAGTKDYFVTQTNSRSCESLKAKVSVVVKPEPSSPTISKSLVEYCQGVTAAPLAATPAASGTLNWYGTSATGGSSSATAPVPSTETEGITSYYVGQTLAGCLSSRAKIDVKINVTPKPTLGTPSVAYCQGASASPLSAEGTNLKWYLTLTDTNPRTTALTPFTEKVEDYSFYVTQTGTNTCESQKAEIKVHIKPLPSATISGSNSVSPGQSTTITVNFTGDAPWSYTLSNGQTGTSSNATTQITVTPQTTTNYVVTKVSNACGEGLSNGVAVVTVLIPTITTGNPSVSQLCAGRSFTIPFQKSGDFPSGNVFTAQISTQNDITKFVSIPSVVNGSVLTASIPDTVKAGSYFIRVVSAGQGNTLPGSVSSVKMTINPLPVATITGPSNILMGQTATLNVAITGDAPWTFNLNDGAKDTLISSSVSPVAVRISPKTTTIYQITSISNTCGVGRGAGTFRVQVDPILGVEPPVPVADWLKVYPTMIENKCTVEITGTISAREALVEIVDLNGRSLFKKSIRQKITEVDFTSKPSGMYLLKVQNGDRSSVQRIFKP